MINWINGFNTTNKKEKYQLEFRLGTFTVLEIKACLFCEKWEEWCYEDVSRIPGLGNPDYDYTKRPSKTNRYIFPEAQLMSFINAHDYTIYDSELRSQIPLETELLSFAQLMTDQWRYDWYEGWNPSILEEIRNCEINS